MKKKEGTRRMGQEKGKMLPELSSYGLTGGSIFSSPTALSLTTFTLLVFQEFQ